MAFPVLPRRERARIGHAVDEDLAVEVIALMLEGAGGQARDVAIVLNARAVPIANANARVSANLPYVLAAARFAHYFKAMMRDKIGSFMTRDHVAAFLNTWIADYVLLDDNAPQAVKARYPLREARVDVIDIAGKPGSFKAVAFLRPHFQLEELTVSMRLVAELPPPAA